MKSNRNILIIIVLALSLPALWYVLSPLWRTNELHEPAPGTVFQAGDETVGMNDIKKRRYLQAMENMGNEKIELEETMPAEARTLVQGTFVDGAHSVDGTALVIEFNGQKTLRLEQFATLNGPNLHIYLATDASGKDFVDLGVIKATHGDVNYLIPSDVDLNRYTHVLVWCVPFRVLFGSAALQ